MYKPPSNEIQILQIPSGKSRTPGLERCYTNTRCRAASTPGTVRRPDIYLNRLTDMEKMEDKTIQSVCIYCASSTKIDPVYIEAAEKLGMLLGTWKIRVINGAGSIGLMRIISDAALKAGGSVTGVIPRFMVENGWGHPGLTERIEVETMHERKQLMANMADAVIALPGGCGTLEELLEIITWKQLGLYKGPVIILNTNGYFDPLIEMLKRAIAEHFMHPGHSSIWTLASTPEEALLFKTEAYRPVDKITGTF